MAFPNKLKVAKARKAIGNTMQAMRGMPLPMKKPSPKKVAKRARVQLPPPPMSTPTPGY